MAYRSKITLAYTGVSNETVTDFPLSIALEDARYGADVRGDELPVFLQRRQVRLAAIRAARERLEASQPAVDDGTCRCGDADRRGRKPGQKCSPTRKLRATSRTPSLGS